MSLNIIAPEEDPWLGREEEPRIEFATHFLKADATADPVADLPLKPPAPVETPLAPQTFAETPVDISPPPKPIAPFLSAMSVRPPAPPNERALPLFKRGQGDDEPLIKVPAAPRPPLAVQKNAGYAAFARRPTSVSRGALPPPLQFSEQSGERTTAPPEQKPAPASVVESSSPDRTRAVPSRVSGRRSSTPCILLGIDAAVVYFTVRMAGLSMDEWTVLPVAPMVDVPRTTDDRVPLRVHHGGWPDDRQDGALAPAWSTTTASRWTRRARCDARRPA